MSAPSPLARTNPAGIKLIDGFPTKVTFASDPDIEWFEKEVTPWGLDGGEPIPQSTMFNTLYHTDAPRTLIRVSDLSIVAAYDPVVMTKAIAILNKPTTITITHPDLSTEAAFGWLMNVKRNSHSEGVQPEITADVHISNWDPVGKVEAGPVVASVAGT